MWKEDKDIAYKKFLSRKPTIDAYEFELKRFVEVEDDIASEPPLHDWLFNAKHKQPEIAAKTRGWYVEGAIFR